MTKDRNDAFPVTIRFRIIKSGLRSLQLMVVEKPFLSLTIDVAPGKLSPLRSDIQCEDVVPANAIARCSVIGKGYLQQP